MVEMQSRTDCDIDMSGTAHTAWRKLGRHCPCAALLRTYDLVDQSTAIRTTGRGEHDGRRGGAAGGAEGGAAHLSQYAASSKIMI